MFSSPDRTPLLSRFLAGGAINTAVGFSVIFLLMLLGVAAVTANICGYAVGLALSFVLNRRFVFVAHGGLSGELIRFLAAFGVSFAANLGVLQLLIGAQAIDPYIAQLVAAATYTLLMFALCDAFVFTARDRNQ